MDGYDDFVNPEFHRYIENMFGYTRGEFGSFHGGHDWWLVDPNKKQWGEQNKHLAIWRITGN